jgi:hypothetical protein
MNREHRRQGPPSAIGDVILAEGNIRLGCGDDAMFKPRLEHIILRISENIDELDVIECREMSSVR